MTDIVEGHGFRCRRIKLQVRVKTGEYRRVIRDANVIDPEQKPRMAQIQFVVTRGCRRQILRPRHARHQAKTDCNRTKPFHERPPGQCQLTRNRGQSFAFVNWQSIWPITP